MGFSIRNLFNSGINGAKHLLQNAEDAVVQTGEEAAHMATDVFSKTGDLVMSAEKSISDLASEAKDKLLEGGKELLGMDPVDYKVTRDPSDANVDEGSDILDSQRRLNAEKPQEAAALAKLSPQDQAAYQKVADRVQNDVRARQAWQQLLIDGKLPGGKDLVGGKTLLENLKKVAEQPVASGIDQNAMVADLVQEIADPSCIDQQARNTCGATTAQILVARQNPAEYARIVGGLASPQGEVKIHNGDTLKRDPNWKADDGGRTISSKLIQPAFMDQSNGKLFSYSNQDDGRKVGKWAIPGMLPSEMAKLLRDVTGKNYSNYDILTLNPVDQAQFSLFFNKIKQAAPGKEVPIMVNYADQESAVAPHWLMVTGVKNGQVSYINPWGREESMPLQELRRHLLGYVPEG